MFPETATLEPLMVDEEVAKVLRVAPITLRKWRASKRHALVFLRLNGRAIRYRRRDVQRYLEKQLVKPTTEAAG